MGKNFFLFFRVVTTSNHHIEFCSCPLFCFNCLTGEVLSMVSCIDVSKDDL